MCAIQLTSDITAQAGLFLWCCYIRVLAVIVEIIKSILYKATDCLTSRAGEVGAGKEREKEGGGQF